MAGYYFWAAGFPIAGKTTLGSGLSWWWIYNFVQYSWDGFARWILFKMFSVILLNNFFTVSVYVFPFVTFLIIIHWLSFIEYLEACFKIQRPQIPICSPHKTPHIFCALQGGSSAAPWILSSQCVLCCCVVCVCYGTKRGTTCLLPFLATQAACLDKHLVWILKLNSRKKLYSV